MGVSLIYGSSLTNSEKKSSGVVIPVLLELDCSYPLSESKKRPFLEIWRGFMGLTILSTPFSRGVVGEDDGPWLMKGVIGVTSHVH